MDFEAASAASASAGGAIGKLRRLVRRLAPMRIDSRRWIVLDVESSGLNPRRDRLLSIAALALDASVPDQTPSLRLADSFEVVLRQSEAAQQTGAAANRSNILIHGIGLGAQAQGVDARLALEALEQYVGASPLLAFHSKFDQTLIERLMLQTLGRRLRNPWIDLEHVAAVLCKQAQPAALDEWIKRLGLQCEARHLAAADALVSAQLLQKLWPLLAARKQDSWEGIARVAGEVRFMPGRG